MQYLGGESMNSCTTRHCNRLLNEMGTTKSMRRILLGLYRLQGLTNRAPLGRSSRSAPLHASWCQLGQSPAHEHRSGVRPQTARPHQHYYILSGLELRLQLVEVAFAVNRLFVDLQDHVASADADVIGKTTRLYVLNDHALGVGQF